jgi:hypothetical protein
MKGAHVVAIALLLGLAAVFGLVAATKTARVEGGGQAQASAATIAARTKTLDRTEAALRRALRDRPPALPPARGASQQQVVVRRPAPLIVVTHHRGGEHEVEHEAEGHGGDD